MKRAFLNPRGQFIPITGMVLFTMMVFLVAVVNIYTVTREKLKVQNLADAAALNLAAQQAQAFNLVADKNEWLNHMMEGMGSPTRESGSPDCSPYTAAAATLIPGVSCVNNNDGTGVGVNGRRYNGNNDPANRRHIFYSRDGAINYALVIHTVNMAQKLFLAAYNSFLGAPSPGAGVQSSNASPRNFAALLKKDIPALSDPSVRMVAWNSANREVRPSANVDAWNDAVSNGDSVASKLEPLNFEIAGDIQTRYFIGNNSRRFIAGATLGQLLYGCMPRTQMVRGQIYGECGPLNGQQPIEKVGWYKRGNMPTLKVGTTDKVGVGVLVEKRIELPVIGSRIVVATAKAYLVGAGDDFHPRYWVKLSK